MKHKEKILSILTFSLLCHYFVLTYFKVEGTESFSGKVEKIIITDKGIFPKADVKFEVEKDDDGEKKIITKTISLIQKDIKKFKVGKRYLVKTHKHWLVSLR